MSSNPSTTIHKELTQLFSNNKRWVADVLKEDSDFFKRLENQQAPKYLWIGCSDSRVPANQITGLMPGEVFVHRNIANMVIHTDLNLLSVLQFAVDVLGVEHIIICGHYGCAGVLAGLIEKKFGLVDLWLRHVKDVAAKHNDYLGHVIHDQKHQRLCELNVIEQSRNIAQTHIVQDAWASGKSLQVHGLIYGVSDGILRDLACNIAGTDDLKKSYEDALNLVYQK
jgi:carbonic anhydrase